MTTLHTRSVLALALCGGLGALALAQPPGAAKDVPKKDPAPASKDAPPANPKDAPGAKGEPVLVKAFEIKIATPAQVQQALSKLTAAPVATKGGPAPAPSTFRTAFDARTKSLFVRGTAAEIASAESLIAQADKGTLYHLQNASVAEVTAVLTALDIGGKIQADPLAKTIAVFETDPNGDQIKAVIARLDGVKTEAPASAPSPGSNPRK